MKPKSFSNPGRSSSRHTQGMAREVTGFLQSNDAMASLLPAIERLAAIQQACRVVMPVLFQSCDVLHFAAGQLVLRTPNAALAARLKQQLLKLQQSLNQKGWQVDTIRIRVQVSPPDPTPPQRIKQAIPTHAVSALLELKTSLETASARSDLLTALDAMIGRHYRKE